VLKCGFLLLLEPEGPRRAIPSDRGQNLPLEDQYRLLVGVFIQYQCCGTETRIFGLWVFERNFVESVFATRLDWISLGAEPGLAAASGSGHRLINCEKCSGVAIIILDKVVIEADCRYRP
jgi:hypothetical protein